MPEKQSKIFRLMLLLLFVLLLGSTLPSVSAVVPGAQLGCARSRVKAPRATGKVKRIASVRVCASGREGRAGGGGEEKCD